jgi:hypothetical protein
MSLFLKAHNLLSLFIWVFERVARLINSVNNNKVDATGQQFSNYQYGITLFQRFP